MEKGQERLPLLPAYASGDEMFFIMDALRDEAFGHSGNHIEKFTEEMAELLDVKGVRLVSNAVSALHLVCRLVGVEKGDTVFCSASMSIELAEPVLELGAELMLIDSDMETWNMSPSALKKALHYAFSNHCLPKLVIVSHSYGQTAKIDEICSLCKSFGVMVIEDASEALGSFYKGRMCGTWSEFGIFSFDSDKIITTSSGGMLVSSQFDKLGEALHKAFLFYPTTEMGYTYSMNNILAGMGRGQLQELQQRIINKQKIFKLYKRVLVPLRGIDFLSEAKESAANRWLTTLLVEEKKAGISAFGIVSGLEQLNIEASMLKKPLQLYLSLQNCRLFTEYPGRSAAEYIYERGMCLPSGSYMKAEEQFQVMVAFRNIYHRKNKSIQ